MYVQYLLSLRQAKVPRGSNRRACNRQRQQHARAHSPGFSARAILRGGWQYKQRETRKTRRARLCLVFSPAAPSRTHKTREGAQLKTSKYLPLTSSPSLDSPPPSELSPPPLFDPPPSPSLPAAAAARSFTAPLPRPCPLTGASLSEDTADILPTSSSAAGALIAAALSSAMIPTRQAWAFCSLLLCVPVPLPCSLCDAILSGLRRGRPNHVCGKTPVPRKPPACSTHQPCNSHRVHLLASWQPHRSR